MKAAHMLTEFGEHTARLHKAGALLAQQITQWIAGEADQKVHSVTYRLKERASLAAKLARPDRNYRELWGVTDLLGLRVITYFEDDVDRIGRMLERRLPIRFEHSKDRRAQSDDRAFGYRSLHYVCGFPRELFCADVADARHALPDQARFEVQVRTVLEHAWAEIEHDLGYKGREAIPSASRRRLHRLAGLLELADQEFVAVRRELEGYAKSLPSRIESEDAAVPLDLLSLQPLLACAEVARIDQAIAEALGTTLGREAFYPDYLLRMLKASGLRTVSEARHAMRARESEILALVLPYFAFAERTWKLRPFADSEVLLRGYALFFLAHSVVLGNASLDVHRIAKLAELYQTLDYPDDPKTAGEVAELLVEAFRP
jgi:putative GTP pyrophosphokinase